MWLKILNRYVQIIFINNISLRNTIYSKIRTDKINAQSININEIIIIIYLKKYYNIQITKLTF